MRFVPGCGCCGSSHGCNDGTETDCKPLRVGSGATRWPTPSNSDSWIGDLWFDISGFTGNDAPLGASSCSYSYCNGSYLLKASQSGTPGSIGYWTPSATTPATRCDYVPFQTNATVITSDYQAFQVPGVPCTSGSFSDGWAFCIAGSYFRTFPGGGAPCQARFSFQIIGLRGQVPSAGWGSKRFHYTVSCSFAETLDLSGTGISLPTVVQDTGGFYTHPAWTLVAKLRQG